MSDVKGDMNLDTNSNTEKHVTHVGGQYDLHSNVAANKKTTFGNRLTIAFAALGSLTYGYGASVVSSTVGQPGWLAAFRLTTDTTSPAYTHTSNVIATTNGLFSAGGAVGCLICMFALDYFGRKRSIQIGAFIEIIGAALQTGCVDNNLAMWYAARFVSGLGIGMLVTSVPLYQSELAKPLSRGFDVGFHAMFLVGGYFFSAWVGFGCYFSTNLNFAWRFPLALLILFPLLLLVGSPWMYRSPRWLVLQDHYEEAWETICDIHVHGGVQKAGPMPSENDDTGLEHDAEVSLARLEFRQITQQIAHEKKRAVESGGRYRRFLTVPSYRKRLWIGFLTQFGAETGGPLVINNYQVLIYTNLGQTGYMPLLLISLWLTTAVFYNILGASLVDRVGRRRFMLIGMAACCIITSIEAALTAEYASTKNKVGNGFAIFFIFLYLAFQGTFIDCSMYLYPSEIFPMEMRAFGMGFSLFGQFAATLILLQTAPIGFQNVGWKYYLVIIICSFVYFWIIWAFFPETKDLTLEEIGIAFGDDPSELSEAVREDDTGNVSVAQLRRRH